MERNLVFVKFTMKLEYGPKLRTFVLTLSSTAFPRRLLCSTYCGGTPHENSELVQSRPLNTTTEQKIQTKLLKIAMIGRPNAGKSTLINQLIGRRVCPISCKQHTTKISARAVQTEGLTQLVYLDTPGLVTEEEFRRFSFDENFKLGVYNSVKEADIIGVIHDTNNKYTRHHLDHIILDLLNAFKAKDSILVINKIDLLKKKRHLIFMTHVLTGENQRHKNEDGGSWPHFKEIFYVSADTGDGVGDLKAYFMMQARPAKWLFNAETSTDLPLPKLIVNTLEASLLDALAHEIPRRLKISVRTLDRGEDGAVFATVVVRAAKSSHCAIIVGRNAMTLRKIAIIAERNLASALRAPVHIKISVCSKDDD